MEKLTEQILPDQEGDRLDIETEELQFEHLDFWTLSFLREHIEMPERIDFDPDKELKQIKKAIIESPKKEQPNQRALLVANFKKRLKTLRENMARAQLELEEFIRGNPQADRKKLFQIVEEIAHQNNVSSQIDYLQRAADLYFRAHVDIDSTASLYKTRYADNWHVKLFEDLFGQPPHGPIEIEVMPMNIYIKIASIEDYVVANGAPENIARNSGGASLQKEFPKVKALSAKVLIENTSMTNQEDSEKRIKPHEEEHSIHNIYPRSAFIKGEQNWLRDIRLNQKIELPLLNAVIHGSIANILLGDWLRGAKTEILAYMKNGKNVDYISQQLTDPEGLYCYLDSTEHYQSWFLGHLKNLGIEVSDPSGSRLSEEEIRTMYSKSLETAWHKRYMPMLEKAFKALKILLVHYGADKYPEVMRLLSQEPINKWPRLAKILS